MGALEDQWEVDFVYIYILVLSVEPGLTHKATGFRVRMGQGFGGFLGLL